MKIDPAIPSCQVLIIANTRDLIRQVQQVISRISQNTNVKICIGDNDFDTPNDAAQIVVTVPKWVDNRISRRNPLDLSKLKMIIYDEADEIFI